MKIDLKLQSVATLTLVDDVGNEKYVSVEDDWLTENGLDVGSVWPKEI